MGQTETRNGSPPSLTPEDIENFRYALDVIRDYTICLFQRAWGTVFIFWGVLFPVTFLLFVKAEEIADALGLGSASVVTGFAGLLSLVVPAVTIYTFGKATILTSKKERMSFRRDAPHAIAVASTYLLASLVAGWALPYLGILAYLWAIGAANLVAYIVLAYAHRRRHTEILISGVGLIAASLPLSMVADTVVQQWLGVVAFGACFVVAGCYGRLTADRFLTSFRG